MFAQPSSNRHPTRPWQVFAIATGLAMGVLPASTPAMAADETSAETCSLTPGSVRTVTRIIDGETLALDDGKEVRLIGALAPRAQDAGAGEGQWPLEEAARSSLAELTLGKPVELAFGATREDRYGRLLAHIFVREGARRLWVQGEMLQLGLARAYVLPRDDTCFTELAANEAVGRTAEAGVWASPLYTVRRAANTMQLLGQRGTFQIVRGKVASVSRTKSAVYVNFGSDWRTDFTLRIATRLLRARATPTAEIEALAGRVVEVRGWVERRNGPMISVSSAAEFRILDNDPSGDAATNEPDASTNASGTVSAPAFPNAAPGTPQKQNRPEQRAPGDVDL